MIRLPLTARGWIAFVLGIVMAGLGAYIAGRLLGGAPAVAGSRLVDGAFALFFLLRGTMNIRSGLVRGRRSP
jgi:hypothetical protein